MAEMHSQSSEESLVKRAVQRDRVAFATLYDNYVVPVYRHVYYRVPTQADAEDITQEVFIKAWKAIDKYRYTGASFMAWLTAIAHNLIADHYRARKKHASLEEAEVAGNTAETSPEAMVEVTLNRIYVRNAIFKLKKERQKVILMRFIDGFSYAEIAKVLNRNEGAVRVIQHRALKDLKEILMRSE